MCVSNKKLRIFRPGAEKGVSRVLQKSPEDRRCHSAFVEEKTECGSSGTRDTSHVPCEEQTVMEAEQRDGSRRKTRGETEGEGGAADVRDGRSVRGRKAAR